MSRNGYGSPMSSSHADGVLQYCDLSFPLEAGGWWERGRQTTKVYLHYLPPAGFSYTVVFLPVLYMQSRRGGGPWGTNNESLFALLAACWPILHFMGFLQSSSPPLSQKCGTHVQSPNYRLRCTSIFSLPALLLGSVIRKSSHFGEPCKSS